TVSSQHLAGSVPSTLLRQLSAPWSVSSSAPWSVSSQHPGASVPSTLVRQFRSTLERQFPAPWCVSSQPPAASVPQHPGASVREPPAASVPQHPGALVPSPLLRQFRSTLVRQFPAPCSVSHNVRMPHLFDPIAFRDVTLPNRIIVSPMCQYSSTDGFPNDWHMVHLGSRAIGGAGLVFTEAAAVTADGRISPDDLGIWSDAHVGAFHRVVRFIKGEGSAAGIQLAHAGRKASTYRPWGGQGAVPPEAGGWVPIGPTDEPFAPNYPKPRAMTRADIADVVDAFRQAARRALLAGFDVVELHAAHGYLIHEFLSPLTNTRTDEYGGSFDNRVRLCLEVVDAVRTIWIDERPLFVRISSTDWVPGGWDLDQSIELARRLHARGV